MPPPLFNLHSYYLRFGFFLKESFRTQAGKYVTHKNGVRTSVRNFPTSGLKSALREQTLISHGGIILSMLPDLQLKDHLRLRKPHPCGSYEWTVVRLGADIGLECNGCQHRVLLTRRELAKRMKANLTKHEENKEETK